MKRSFILVLTVLVLATVDSGTAQEGGKSKPLPRTEVAKTKGEKPYIGKVTRVNEKTSEVTMQGRDGETLTLNFSNPKVGTCPAGAKAKAWMVNNFAVGDVVVAKYILTIEKDGRYSSCQDCIDTCCGQCVSGPGGRCFCFENIPARSIQDCYSACKRAYGANASAIAECEAGCRQLSR